jgi:DivIVA domain-containing protein
VATRELDTAALRPGDIAGQRFTIAKRGYEPQEVHQFLQSVADHFERLHGEIDWARARIEHLEQRSLVEHEGAYERLSREFMEVVRRADEAASHVRARAEDEARLAVTGAHEEANRMIASAGGEAERVLITAREEAERLVAEATWQVERLLHDAEARATSARYEEVMATSIRDAEATAASVRAVADSFDQDPDPADPEREREASKRRHPAWSQPPRQEHWTEVRYPTLERAAVSVHWPVAPPDRSEAPTVLQDAPDRALADFEDLNLEFESSMFDLFGEAGP